MSPSARPWRPGSGQWMPPALLAAFCAASLLLLRARAADPMGVRLDAWSEANVIVSARNVMVNGWATYAGVAQHQVHRPPFKNDPLFYYAHYPLGPYYINWLLYGMGVTKLSALRWLPDLCALGTVVLWYLLLCHFIDRWGALLSSFVLGTSFAFLAYADNIHQGFTAPLVVGMMLSYVAGVARTGRRRLFLLATSWVVVLVNAFLSWEWYLFSQLFYWGHALLFGTPFKRRWLLVFALAPLIAFGVQSRVRAAAFGGDSGGGVFQDFLRRTIRMEETVDTPFGVTLANYPRYVAERFGQVYGLGIGTLWLYALLWGALIGGVGREWRVPHPAFRWMALLFMCGVSWWGLMLQHTAVHEHVMRHALFFYALVVGLCLTAAADVVFGKSSPVASRAGAAILAAALIWPHASGCYADLRLHGDPSFREPHHWSDGWREPTYFREVAQRLPHGDAIILTNHNRLPLLRYWTKRPVYSATLERYPFRRGTPVPGSRYQIELVLNHLRDLYSGDLPRLWYLYFFRSSPDSHYKGDAVLWQLVDGTWNRPATRDRFDNFRQLVRRQGGDTKYPVVARGDGWLCFDASRLVDAMPEDWRSKPPPTRAEFGPPR